MFSDIKNYVKVLAKYQLTEHQLLILYLIDSGNVDCITEYKDTVGNFKKEEYEDLVDRGFISQAGNLDIANIEFDIEADYHKMFEEVFNIYPNNLNINGEKVSAKSCNFDMLAKYYYNTIVNGSISKHITLYNKIEKAFKNVPFAKMGIDKFFRSKEYERLDDSQYVSNMIRLK